MLSPPTIAEITVALLMLLGALASIIALALMLADKLAKRR